MLKATAADRGAVKISRRVHGESSKRFGEGMEPYSAVKFHSRPMGDSSKAVPPPPNRRCRSRRKDFRIVQQQAGGGLAAVTLRQEVVEHSLRP